MTREEFIRGIDITKDDIIGTFDDIMVLFNLCGSVSAYENFKISKTSSELASFDISCSTIDIAEQMNSVCNGLRVPLYDIMFSIHCELDDNIVHITLR